MQKIKQFSFKYQQDAGHGWLAVKRSLLLQYPETAAAITAYSYQRNETVYLEEDCDTQLFLEALRQQGHRFTILALKPATRSQIRSYDRFVLSQEEKSGPSGTLN